MNNIFGLVESFSHDFYCPICYVTRASALIYFLENQFNLRNKSEYEKDLRDILNNPKLTHVRGVKGISFLNRSMFWHWTGNYCLDIMHIFDEGVILEVLACIINEFVKKRKLLPISELNERVRATFSSMPSEKANTPSPLNEPKEIAAGLHPKMAATETRALFRFLPLIIGHLIPNGDQHWHLFLQLSRLADIANSETPTEDLLNEFSQLTHDHLTLFRKLYPSLGIRPKQHFLIHIPTVIRNSGPLRHNSSLKYELRNQSIKRPSQTICNYKNIPKTLTERNQFAAMQHVTSGFFYKENYVSTHKIRNETICNIPGNNSIAGALGLNFDDFVQVCKRIKYCGTSYGVEDIVIFRIENELPVFFQVDQVIWHNDAAYLVGKKMRNMGFVSHFHAYEIEDPRTSPQQYETLKIDNLADYHPLSIRYYCDISRFFVRLRHAVV